jgi:lysophospholipase L1-like esterase
MTSQKTVVCFGDSITYGQIGASYLSVLRERLPPEIRLVNAGVNGDTTLNMLHRVERDVAPHHPDLVIVLAGLNDIGSAYGEPGMRRYYQLMKRPGIAITPQRFIGIYRRLIARLRLHTSRVALCTPTLLGEWRQAPFQPQVDAYSVIIRGLAHQHNLDVIDLRLAFDTVITADPRPGPAYQWWTPIRDGMLLFFQRKSYADLTRERNYRLTCDGVHLSETGATLIADTMQPYLERVFLRQPAALDVAS